MKTALRIAVAGLLVSAAFGVHTPNGSAAAPDGFTASLVQGGLDAGPGGLPVAFAYAPDGRIFIARKQGIIDVWDAGVQHTFADLRTQVNSSGGRGLLGLALDPNFATNNRVFALFTEELDPADPDDTGTAGGEIISIQAQSGDPDSADFSTEVSLLSGYQATSTEHTVGGLRFDNQGDLMATFGDSTIDGDVSASALTTLDLDDLHGKLIRIDPNTGAGVPGNPYYDAGQPNAIRSLVYARGFRNAYRFTVDPDNGTVYVGDVGWNTWEMLNAFPTTFDNPDKDRNAGWPCYEGGDGVALPQPDFEYAPATQATCQTIYPPEQGGTGVGVSAPLYGYRHKEPGGENGSAITAGPKYVGTSNYPAQYVGQLFVGDYARDRFEIVDPTTGAASDFGTQGDWGNPVDIQIAPDGNVAYLAIGTAELREIVYTGSNHVPVAVATAAQTASPTAPFTAQFDGSQSSDADPDDTLTYDWNFADGSPDSNLVSPAHDYVKAGSYDVTLTVSDGHPGGTVSTDLWIDVANTPPTVTLTSPSPSFRYKIGDTINLRLDGEDAEDGHLRQQHLSSEVRLIHLDHFHPIIDFTGTHASFTVMDHGSDFTYYEVITTVTDRFGRSTTQTFDILPNKQPVSITSTPPGATLSVDGVQATTPYNFLSIIGEHHEINAPADFNVNGDDLAFNRWTQGDASVNTEFFAFDTPPNGTTVSADYSPTDKGLSISDDSITEGKTGARTVALDVSLSTPQSSTVTVDYATADGTGPGAATAPDDYTATSGTLTFAPGVVSQEVDVAVNGDKTVEGDEQFSVGLSNAQGAPIVAGTGAVTILNDDPGGGLRLAVGDVQLLEGDAGTRAAHVTVSLSAPSPGGVSVDYSTADGSATAPSDYATTAGTLTFAAGTTAMTVDVPINGDGAYEPSEAFTFGLSNAVGAPISRATGTVNLANDDPGPALSVGNVTTVEGNSGSRAVFFTVALSTPSANTVVVNWALTHQTTNDGDVKRRMGTATFAPGQLFEKLQIVTYGDTDVEPDETYLVTLSNPVNAVIASGEASGSATGTILNDDPSSGLVLNIGDAAIAEGNSGDRQVQLTVGLSDPAPSPVTVDYVTNPGTARAKIDYASRKGTLTIKAGATSASVSIIVHGDAAPEPDETFTVVLSNPTGGATLGRATGTGTIVDDD